MVKPQAAGGAAAARLRVSPIGATRGRRGDHAENDRGWPVSAAVLAGPALAQERWDGADDLPTSTRSPATATRGATSAAKPYDGGAADRRARPRRARRSPLVDVPKLIGIGYFDATTQGHAGGRRGARQRHGRPPTARPRPTSTTRSRSSTTTSPRASTASCSPPTTRSRSRRC